MNINLVYIDLEGRLIVNYTSIEFSNNIALFKVVSIIL